MRDPLCTVSRLLPDVHWAALSAHREQCLRCQAEAARWHRLVHDLAALGADVMPAPPTLQAGVLARLGPQDAANPRRALITRAIARYAAAAGFAAGLLVALLSGLARRRSRAMV
jgi:anti-sigma factor RsiW